MEQRELARGAEAVIYEEGKGIRKHRPKKAYRHPTLDAALRKQRTRKEAKVLRDLKRIGVPAPELIAEDDEQGVITMTAINGKTLRDVLNEDIGLCAQVGRHVATMHDHDLLHGDLTTSNMVVVDSKVFLIDFGLSFHSTRIEDKAVDLHLFKQALESKHHLLASQAWKKFLQGYKPRQREHVLQRLRVVEQRGRNKT